MICGQRTHNELWLDTVLYSNASGRASRVSILHLAVLHNQLLDSHALLLEDLIEVIIQIFDGQIFAHAVAGTERSNTV